MLAAEAAFSALASDETAGTSGDRAVSLTSYSDAIKASWVWDELHVARNIRPVSPSDRINISTSNLVELFKRILCLQWKPEAFWELGKV